MGAVLPFNSARSVASTIISMATPRELFDRLAECEREIARNEGVVDADQTNSTRARDAYRLLGILRNERADIEAAMAARFLMWSGGVTAEAFLERIV